MAIIKTKTIANANIFKYKIAQSASSSQRSPKTQIVNTNLPNDGYIKHTRIKNVKRIKIMSILYAFFFYYSIKRTKHLVWIGNDSSQRTQNALKEILKDAYSGKFTKDEFMDKLRSSFDTYANLEPHKLKAAANWHLRQNQNLSIALRANEYDTKFVKIRAKMDSKTTQICRSLHGRLIPVEHIIRQANGIINAKTPKEMMSYTDPHSGGVWGKLPYNIGLPPYHFGCRTMIEEVPNALADEYMLDEFDRGYKFKENKHKLKYNKHKNEVKGRNYDKAVKETLSNIAYEGTHYREEGKKVVFGSNGFIAYINSNNEIETCYKPTSGFRKFEQDVNIVYYNAIDTKLKRLKKWLNIFSW